MFLLADSVDLGGTCGTVSDAVCLQRIAMCIQWQSRAVHVASNTFEHRKSLVQILNRIDSSFACRDIRPVRLARTHASLVQTHALHSHSIAISNVADNARKGPLLMLSPIMAACV